MRVAFLTNKTTRVSLPVLKKLAESDKLELVHVFFFDTLAAGRSSPLTTLRELGVGTVALKLMGLAASRVRMVAARCLGSSRVQATSPLEYVRMQRLCCSVTSDMNDEASRQRLAALDVDVLVTCVCKNILRGELLTQSRTHFVNIHPSLLPAYRGPRPTFWMLFHGEERTGFSVHLMTPKIDSGTILYQQSLPLDQRQSEPQIESAVFQEAALIIEEVLLHLHRGELPPSPQVTQSRSSYFTYPTAADRKELKRRSKRPRRPRE